MNSRVVKIIFLCVLGGTILFPIVAQAASGSVSVGQQAGTVVVPPNPGGGGSGGGFFDTTPPQIIDVSVAVKFDTATILWTTNELSLAKLSWGRTQDYSDGVISTEQYATKQSIALFDLQSNQQYYFLITAIDQYGNQSTYAGLFFTLPAPDLTPPLNVTQFNASPRQDRIVLSWQNPPDSDFDLVRIVRSEQFYPLDPFNGAVVYEGSGSFNGSSNGISVEDTTVTPGKVYFYTAFSRDHTGNYSSGALSSAMILWYSETNQYQPEAPVVDIRLPKQNHAPTPIAQLNDITMTYNHGSAVIDNNNPTIPIGVSLTIQIPKISLPEGTSFLTATVQNVDHPSSTSTYLFSYSLDTKIFTLVLPAFVEATKVILSVTAFNGVKFVLQQFNTIIVIAKAESLNPKPSAMPDLQQQLLRWIFRLSSLLLLLILLRHFYMVYASSRKP